MIRFLLGGVFTAVLAVGIVLGTPRAHAQAPTTVVVPVALTPVQRNGPVALVALTLDANISESNGHTIIAGNSTFKLHNTDVMNDLQLPVGFPAWAGDPYVFDPTRLDSFSVSIDGRKTSLNPSRAELRIGNAVRTVDWYTFTLPIGANEKRTVRYDFQQDLGDAPLARFVYGIIPAVGFKGSIGSARLTLRFPDQTSLEQIVGHDPANASFDGQTLNWLVLNHEPPTNPNLTILRPSVWQDLASRRRGVTQNPNDSNAHAVLGSLLRHLSSFDSAGRDSYAMQAIAEFEMAARLDPKNRAARQALASLYEARAGPPAGPRQAVYVALAAAQWESLAPTDADAQKQLAEDYFFLGQDAQARSEFDRAAEYYDKAASLAPRGAGPLYTIERAAALRRALNTAWARSLLDKGDLIAAREKARPALGEAFMASSQPPAFYILRAQVATSIRSRVLALRLVSLGQKTAEVQAGLGTVGKALRAAGAQVEAQPVADSGDINLTITVPFDGGSELGGQLRGAAKAIPGSGEWALVQVLLTPKSLVSEEQDQIWGIITEYREEIDLARACNGLGAQINAITTNLSRYKNVAPNDAEGQLKRALLEAAQAGWQRAVSNSSVLFQAGGNQARVEACSARVMAWTSSSPRLAAFAIVGGGMGGIGLGLVLVLVLWRRKGPSAPATRPSKPDKPAL
jgi:tetratricopeptide (TPR) repeat protein